MAARFWVGGTGNWDASTTTNWSTLSGGAGGSAVPTSADDVTFDGASGGGTVTVTATANCLSLTGGAFTGTLNTNGQTVTVAGSFNFSGTGTRSLTLGASTINCTSWSLFTTTGLTFSGASSTIAITGNVSGSFFNGGTQTYGTVTVAAGGGGNTRTFTGANTFTTLTYTGASGTTSAVFSMTGNQTITGTLTINGNSTTNRLLITSDIVGTPRTLSAGTVSITNADFQDITGTGAGSWNLAAITGNSGDCGGNTGITFTTAADQHWTNASTGSWSLNTNWTSRVPLPQDNVFIDKAMGTSQTITADMPRMGKNIDFTGATWTTALTWNVGNILTFYGSMTLIANLSIVGNFTTTYSGRGSSTLSTKSLDFKNSLNIDCGAGTLTLSDDYLSTANNRVLQMTSGTFNANNFNVSMGSVIRSGGATCVINMGSGTWLCTFAGTGWSFGGAATGLTINAQTSTIKFNDSSASTKTFAGGGFTYNNFWFAPGAGSGSITISGSNTFNDFKDDGTAAHSILFTVATNTHISTFTVSGTTPNQITITSTTTGSHTLTYSGVGVVNSDWLNIQHSIATAGRFFAELNSTNNQGTVTAGSGWVFNTLGLANPSMPAETVTVSENIQINIITSVSVFDSATVSENIVLGYSLPSPIVDSVTVTENIKMMIVSSFLVFDSITVTENLQDVLVDNISPFESVTVTENLKMTGIEYVIPPNPAWGLKILDF